MTRTSFDHGAVFDLLSVYPELFSVPSSLAELYSLMLSLEHEQLSDLCHHRRVLGFPVLSVTWHWINSGFHTLDLSSWHQTL